MGAVTVATHSIRRLGTPEDVARAALFLASDVAGRAVLVYVGTSPYRANVA